MKRTQMAVVAVLAWTCCVGVAFGDRNALTGSADIIEPSVLRDLQEVHGIVKSLNIPDPAKPFEGIDQRIDEAVIKLIALQPASENRRIVNHVLAALYTRRKQWPEVIRALEKLDETDPWFLYGMQWRLFARAALHDEKGLEQDVALVAAQLNKTPIALEFWNGREWLSLTAADDLSELRYKDSLREIQPSPKNFDRLLSLRRCLPANITAENMSPALAATMEQIDRLAAAQTGPWKDLVGRFNRPSGMMDFRQLFLAELPPNKLLTQETLKQLLRVQEQVAAATQAELRSARQEEARRDAQKNSRKLPLVARPKGNAQLESSKLLMLKHLVATTDNVQGEIRDLNARIGLFWFLQQAEGYFVDLVPFLEGEIIRIGCQESNPATSALSMLKSIVFESGNGVSRDRDTYAKLKDRRGYSDALEVYAQARSVHPSSGLLAVTMALVDASFEIERAGEGELLQVEPSDPFYCDALLLAGAAAVAVDDVAKIEKCLDLFLVIWNQDAPTAESMPVFQTARGDDPRRLYLDRLKYLIAIRETLENRPQDERSEQIAGVLVKLVAANLDARVPGDSWDNWLQKTYFTTPGDLGCRKHLESLVRQAQPPGRRFTLTDLHKFKDIGGDFKDRIMRNLQKNNSGKEVFVSEELIHITYKSLWDVYREDILNRLYKRLRAACEYEIFS